MILAATGHRKTNFDKARENLKHFLDTNNKAIEAGISGMALGWDTIFARACLYYKIPLLCYIPYKDQKPTSEYYDEILSGANKIIYCADSYYKDCFLDRDKLMVDDSGLIIACWDINIKKGGTYYTINYAKKQNKLVFNLWK